MADTVVCARCGARNPEGAGWCGQCFAGLGPDEPDGSPTDEAPPEGAEPDTGDAAAGSRSALMPPAPEESTAATPGTWVCSACETRNPLATEECPACGTTIFAAFGAGSEETTTEVEPQAALARSLIFPGLGHLLVRQGLLGSAIAGLTLMALGFGVAMAASGVARFGWPLIILALAVWVVAAIDAYRIAGERATDGILLKPRFITALVGLVVVLVILAALTTQGGTG